MSDDQKEELVDVWKNESALYIKFSILSHLNNNDWPSLESLKPYAHVDHEWHKVSRLLVRYKNIVSLVRQISRLEFDLSLQNFDSSLVRKLCFSKEGNHLDNKRGFMLCVEPQIPTNFIADFVEEFMNINDTSSFDNFTTLYIAVHTYLHKIWLSASKLEIRPEKSLSGVVSSTFCDWFSFDCRCPKNYLFDTYVFKNHKINVGLNVKIYYTSRLHKIAVRFLKFEFFKLSPLYVRKRPRQLPFDALFDITTFLSRRDLDACQFTCRELFYFIENNKNGFALHQISTARLATKGDFYCFGVFIEDAYNVKDFRERRSKAVISNLFYPILKNASVNKLYIKRIDFARVFDHFKQGIAQCIPLNIRRIVFSAAETDHLSRILRLTEQVLRIQEYEIEVFSEQLMKQLFLEPTIHRCSMFVAHEQYHSNQPILDDLFKFLTRSSRPSCEIVLRNARNEELVNAFLDQLIESFMHASDISSFRCPALLRLNPVPTRPPRLFNYPNQQNINGAFEYDMPTLSNVYHFNSQYSKQWLTVCLGVTMSFPVQRICYFELGKHTY